MGGGQSSTEKKSNEVTNLFPINGITIRGINNFIQENGGRENFVDLTTRQVVEKYILPKTCDAKLSYCELVELNNNDNNKTVVGKPNVFISHSWDNIFLDVVLAISHHYQYNNKKIKNETSKDNEDAKEETEDFDNIVVWFDIFSCNQHSKKQFNDEWWSKTLKSAINQIGSVLLVLTPPDVNKVNPFSRSWCLYELYCTHIASSKFSIAMCLKEQEQFLESICKDYTRVMNKLVGDVDMRTSSCTDAAEREVMMSVVVRDIGMDNINNAVAKIVRNWVLNLLKSASADLNRSSSVADTVVANASGSDLSDNDKLSFVASIQSDPRAALLTRLASTSVMIEQGSCNEAINDLETIAEDFKISSNQPDAKKLLTTPSLSENDAPFMFSVHCNFAAAHRKNKDFEKALQCYQNALAILEGSESSTTTTGGSSRAGSANGMNSPRRTRYTLKIAHLNSSMGSVCIDLEDYQQALIHYQRACDLLAHYYGTTSLAHDSPGNGPKRSHAEVGIAHEDLGKVHELMENYDDALKHFEAALRVCIQCESETHPRVGLIHTKIGRMHQKQAQYEQALGEYTTAMSILHNSVGGNHPYIAETLTNIAELKLEQNRRDEAIEDFNKAIEVYTKAHGRLNDSVADTHYRLGKVYDDNKEFKSALDEYQKALDIKTELVGDEDPSTAHIHCDMAAVYSNLGKYTDALIVHSKTLKIRLLANKTDEHPSVATTYANLGMAYCGLSDYTTALVYCEHSLKIRENKLGKDHPDTKSIYDIVQQLRQKKLHKEASRRGGLEKITEQTDGGTEPVAPSHHSRRD